jgi:hypothetical protein
VQRDVNHVLRVRIYTRERLHRSASAIGLEPRLPSDPLRALPRNGALG